MKGVSFPWKDMPYKLRLAGLKDVKMRYYGVHFSELTAARDASRAEARERNEASKRVSTKSPPKPKAHKNRKYKLEDIGSSF